jgi:hypothetical protein
MARSPILNEILNHPASGAAAYGRPVPARRLLVRPPGASRRADYRGAAPVGSRMVGRWQQLFTNTRAIPARHKRLGARVASASSSPHCRLPSTALGMQQIRPNKVDVFPGNPRCLSAPQHHVSRQRRGRADQPLRGNGRRAPLLLGLGLRNLSMTPRNVPRVKQHIRGLDLTDATRCARMIMGRSLPPRCAPRRFHHPGPGAVSWSRSVITKS